MGPLLFALTLQPVLERIDAACEEAPLVSYLDNMSMVGKLTPAAVAFRRLCVNDDGVRSIGLEPRLPKCGIYSGDKEQVAAEAAKLRIAHKLDGFTAVGTPLGSAGYVSNARGQRAATVDTLVQLPLSVQSQILLLRASLQGTTTYDNSYIVIVCTVFRLSHSRHQGRKTPYCSQIHSCRVTSISGRRYA